MLDEKDLQAIAELMDKKIRESESRMTAYMEAYFEPKFNLLADQNKLFREKTVTLETLEEVEDRIDDLEEVVKQHTIEIAHLKKAQ